MITNSMIPFWRVAFKQAWFAYCADNMPVGCAIFDDDENLIAVGRNSIHDNRGNHIVQLHQLGHGELNALLKVSKFKHADLSTYNLVSTLEPCPMCAGAFAMSRIRTLYYAASDNVAGSTSLLQQSGLMEEKELSVFGPFADMQFIQIAMLAEFVHQRRPAEASVLFPKWRKTDPQAVDVGTRWFREGTLTDMRKEYVAKKISFDEIFDELRAVKC